ncbi:hypothetical protein [Mesobacillus thioparans]
MGNLNCRRDLRFSFYKMTDRVGIVEVSVVQNPLKAAIFFTEMLE